MAAAIPPALKTADVQRFATRAAQLEKYKPVVSYWLEYFILQIILNKQLHATDDEVQAYAVQLMDKLEAFKTANASNDAVVDDVAARAYMEEFALETFERADSAQRGNKVTRATADAFQAAATFLDVQAIWAPLEGECAAKSKFAKFHALRIAKALKAGEDPNATNPKVEEPAKPASGTEDDGLEAELKELENPSKAQGGTTGEYKSPTAETVPNSVQPSRPESTLQGGPSAPPTLPAENINQPEISPIESTDVSAPRAGSIGGGYFPSVPSGTGNYKPPSVDVSTPLDANMDIDTQPNLPSAPPQDAASFYSSQTPAQPKPASPFDRPERPPPDVATVQAPLNPPVQAPTLRSPFTPAPPAAPSNASQPPSVPMSSGPPPGGYRTDDESVMAAQKHAKWAISALNFEDVPTAVKELRVALQNLGAL